MHKLTGAIVIAFVAAAGCAADEPPQADWNDYTPPAGRRVRREVIFDDGHTVARTIETTLDGDVLEGEEVPDDTGLALRGDARGACEDDAFQILGQKIDTSFAWWFEDASASFWLDADAVEIALNRATEAVTFAQNDCGISDEVMAVALYRGRTARGAAVDSMGSCTLADDESVVSFGPLPDGVLAVSCTFMTASGTVLEDDVRLSPRDDWTLGGHADCAGRFGLAPLVAHLRGHTLGLGHVDHVAHPNLAMADLVPVCQADAMLGRGDVLGLRAKY